MILSLDFTYRNQLQQTLHVSRFWQVCVSCDLLSLYIIDWFTPYYPPTVFLVDTRVLLHYIDPWSEQDVYS